jgi:hypothetical protein
MVAMDIYLTHSVQFTLPIIGNKKIYLQCQCNVNLMFKMKKIHETNIQVKPLKPKKRVKQDIKDEQVKDKLSIINDIDTLFR